MSETKPQPGSSVLVALSGGVDSALAAWLLLQHGCRVEGVFMKNWDEDDGTDACTAAEDCASAEDVCARLQIPLRQLSFSPEYWDRVFEPMLEAYRAGQTPNPDVDCNRHIKFGALHRYAAAADFDWLATGHHARLAPGPAGPELLRGRDKNKDQSYFLHAVENLHQVVFPIGEWTRRDVRRLAREADLPNWNRRGSTGICFIGERRFAPFLERYVGAEPGDLVTPEGQVVGRHRGAGFYTFGQRRGLGIGGRSGAAEAPWYVVDTDVAANRVIVVQGDHPLLWRRQIDLSSHHWIGAPPQLPARLTARVRYRQQDSACALEQVDGQLRVTFDRPQRAPAAGQYCVFYAGERCLGGGPIAPGQGGRDPGSS